MSLAMKFSDLPTGTMKSMGKAATEAELTKLLDAALGIADFPFQQLADITDGDRCGWVFSQEAAPPLPDFESLRCQMFADDLAHEFFRGKFKKEVQSKAPGTPAGATTRLMWEVQTVKLNAESDNELLLVIVWATWV